MAPPAEARAGETSPEIALLARRPWPQVESLGHARLAAAVGDAGDAGVARHPAVLLHLARALEPGVRLRQRTAALDHLERILDRVPTGDRRHDALRLELMAERAVDAARIADLDRAETLARSVLDAAGEVEAPAHNPVNGDPFVAAARASEALGRVLAWRGDRHSALLAGPQLLDAAARYRRLGSRDWEGGVLVWKGNAVHFQWGDLPGAEAAMTEGLAVLAPESARRALMLTFYGDLLLTLGRGEEVASVLDEASALAGDDPAAVSYIAWSRARGASLAGDAPATVRWLLEVERHRADWFDMTSGPTFLADAAEILDRVGERDAADAYLARAVARAPGDEFVAQAVALVAARRGDPAGALAALARLAHAPWLEPRLRWRRTLFEAYATLRARRPGAGALAARAFDQAAEQGGAWIATLGEPEVAAVLAPLAAAHGNRSAAEVLAPGTGLVLRVLGDVRLTGPDGEIDLPAGAGGALVRLLSLHPFGLAADQVVDALWPEADSDTGRRRLRDARFRLRSRCGDLVGLDAGRLRLVGVWVDAVAFRAAVEAATAPGGTATAAAAAAMALWSGDPVPGDIYADWAAEPRAQLRRRHLRLLDAVAADAVARGSLEEAGVVLEEAIEADPGEEQRYLRLAEVHVRCGRVPAAIRVLERALDAADRLDLPASPQVRSRLVALRRPQPEGSTRA